LIPVDVVGVRKYGGGSYYLPLPKKLLEKLGYGEGDEFVCYETADGIVYKPIDPSPASIQKEAVVLAE